jgi:urease gamma subunit
LIFVKAKVTGENATTPLNFVFEYSEESYETIFLRSIEAIKERLASGLKINIYECLALYCYYVVTQLRGKRSSKSIQQGIKLLLSQENVLVGVPESVRNIVLYARFNDYEQYTVMLEEPIKIPKYFLQPDG